MRFEPTEQIPNKLLWVCDKDPQVILSVHSMVMFINSIQLYWHFYARFCWAYFSPIFVLWDFVHFLCCGILSCGILSCGILSVGILSCGILSRIRPTITFTRSPWWIAEPYCFLQPCWMCFQMAAGVLSQAYREGVPWRFDGPWEFLYGWACGSYQGPWPWSPMMTCFIVVSVPWWAEGPMEVFHDGSV